MKAKNTSFDIAYRAGVSQSTVSRALRNSPLVNEETRKRVQEIAQELNYKVDKHASSLRTQQSQTIALLLFEDPTNDDSLINPFFLSMLGSITRACSNRGYDLLVSFQQMDNDWHADFEDTRKADGIILLGYGNYLSYRDKLIQLTEQETHFVRWGAEVKELPVVSVGCDNFHGGQQITEHLLENQRDKFAFLGDVSNGAPEFKDRYLGHCQALENANVVVDSALQFDAISTEESGYDAMTALLQSGKSVNAVFAASDLIAVGALRAMKEYHIKVPQDVAIVGFDDITVASFTSPALTTARQDTVLAGEVLVDKLLELISGEKAETRLMPTTLVIRESCGSKLTTP
ncbi:MAG: LacI family DNA-binding transcriptional regulator [Thalassotalea sp.]